MFARAARYCGALLLLATAALGTEAQAQTADLQVSEYSADPSPVGRGGTATFTIRATNNGAANANGATVTIAVSPAFEVLNNCVRSPRSPMARTRPSRIRPSRA